MNKQSIQIMKHRHVNQGICTTRKAMLYLGCLLLSALVMSIGYAAEHSKKDDKTAAPLQQSNAVNQLEKVSFTALPQDVVQIRLKFSKPFKETPRNFITRNPSRIVVDLDNIENNTGKLSHIIGLGVVEKLTLMSAGKRFRVVVDLSGAVKYKTRVHGHSLYINIQSQKTASHTLDKKKRDYGSTLAAKPRFSIKDVDFKRSDKTGRVVIDLSSPDVSVDVAQEGKKIIANFPLTSLPAHLQRRLDVTDFGTPVSSIDIMRKGSSVQMRINSEGAYEHLAYQIGDQFFIDIKELTPAEQEEKKKQSPEYTGKKLSLNFQNIQVRSVLQLLAEFTGINIVVSDSVSGEITLRLTEVPWDQALDIILQTQGLGREQVGNVMLVAPLPELAKREQQELQALKQVEKLAPLQAELIQLNYAKAGDMVQLLTAPKNSILSIRGSASFDERTNTIWVQDTAAQISNVRDFIKRLDKPVKQVLIEARIVEVNKNYEEDLGVRFGISNEKHNVAGDLFGANQLANGSSVQDLNIDDRLNVNLPAVGNSLAGVTAAAAGGPTTLGIALAKIGSDTFLDLELSALETEGLGKVISSPRVITADQQMAKIEQGTEIPYQEATSSGATSVSFKKAVLSLQVTPQITPDSRIIMELKVHKDVPGEPGTGGDTGEPAINTKSVETNVLVKNGETIVLGGIYEQTKTLAVSKTPFLGDIPFVGYAFKRKAEVNNRSELLIFITPKIIMQSEGVA